MIDSTYNHVHPKLSNYAENRILIGDLAKLIISPNKTKCNVVDLLVKKPVYALVSFGKHKNAQNMSLITKSG